MAVTKQRKAETLDELRSQIKNSKVIAIVNFHGLSVFLASNLRREIRKSGASYMVAKKTLIRKALLEFPFEGEMPVMDGEIALAFASENPEILAKILQDFAKKNKDMINLQGGLFENRYIDGKTMVMLANIPPRDVLLTQLVGVLAGPMRNMAGVLQGPIRDFVSVVSKVKI